MKQGIGTMAAAILLVGLGAGLALAGTNDPVVQQREQNQEKRIIQGEKSGALTPREAGRLEAQQTKIKQDEARMKADGKVTPAEKRKLTRKQNRASCNIERQKNNGRRADVGSYTN
jgi:uncharacterized protein HemX